MSGTYSSEFRTTSDIVEELAERVDEEADIPVDVERIDSITVSRAMGAVYTFEVSIE